MSSLRKSEWFPVLNYASWGWPVIGSPWHILIYGWLAYGLIYKQFTSILPFLPFAKAIARGWNDKRSASKIATYCLENRQQIRCNKKHDFKQPWWNKSAVSCKLSTIGTMGKRGPRHMLCCPYSSAQFQTHPLWTIFALPWLIMLMDGCCELDNVFEIPSMWRFLFFGFSSLGSCFWVVCVCFCVENSLKLLFSCNLYESGQCLKPLSFNHKEPCCSNY